MHRRRLLACSLVLGPSVLAASCGPPSDAAHPETAAAEISCPEPIGEIPRESCADVGAEFAVLSVSGAMKQAGKDGTAVLRVDALRAAAALANELKERRVAECDAYNACQVTREEHAAKDKLLADTMASLLALWDARQFANPEAVDRFHASVRALRQRLAGGAPAPGAAAPASKPQLVLPGDKLAQQKAPGVAFSAAGGAVTVRAQAGAARQVLRSAPALRLRGGRRYLVKVLGSYAPAAPPLIAPGAEVGVRLRYRATQAGELFAAVRSLESADATESTASWRLAPGDGAHEAKLVGPAGESGLYLAIGARGAGAIDLDDIELSQGGRVLAAARAEEDREPHVATSCSADAAQPLAGKRSLRCAGHDGDLVTLGLPSAWLEVVVRGASGDRASVRTQSLEGGRSLDAALKEDAEIFVSIAGEGTATIRAIEVRDVSP